MSEGEATRTTVRDDTAFRHRRKYGSKNPVQRLLLGRFHAEIRCLVDDLQPTRVLDFGCGEGFFWREMAEFGPLPSVTGLDLRGDAIAEARATFPDQEFLCVDLFNFRADRGFDLVLAIEVLEHLYEPERYLRKLCELTEGHVLLTVPHEPFFRFSNLIRGRDVLALGNHPEHVQHWSRKSFLRFAEPYLTVRHVSTPFPFIVLLGRPRERD